ncbi:NAD-dependent epimerase/dehydratase family protein [Clostridium estertheticum]|uniref:NAD-dependent epimerase/dehydratase family protein n=1 Tax=Clostridium estertheticum TaxID=238834 RepID=UPI001CF1F35F|nr:NAD(P)-dependent oxidoreductase [Clostridium estertheticum]MCB2359370.1 NAD(P)-dependent oxidoreductase [Clostridium estertheticum]
MKKILVTGATGFIGSQTLTILNQKGYEVHAVTSKGHNRIHKTTDIIWHCFDLLKTSEIEELFENVKPDEMLHLAWYAVPGKYVNSEENLLWVQSSIVMLKNFNNNGGKRFVFAGTCAQYDLGYGYLDEERTPLRPNSLYGVCKLSFENIAQKYCNSNGISFASGRIFYLYGEMEKGNRIIPYVINCLLNNEIAHCSHGNQIRDFLNVKDVACAFVEILQSNIEGSINIGSGEGVKLKNILLKVGEKLGKKDLIHFGDIKTLLEEPNMIVANNKRLMNETNWTQKFYLDNGLDETINWWIKSSSIEMIKK